jgi:hypothetical protein
MKTMVKIFLVAAVIMIMSAVTLMANGTSRVEPVDTLASKSENLVVFKADKNFVGATVEVFYANGDRIAVHKLKKRKMIIDFCNVKHGTYTISITKGKYQREFEYVKK